MRINLPFTRYAALNGHPVKMTTAGRPSKYIIMDFLPDGTFHYTAQLYFMVDNKHRIAQNMR